jgi:predicted  nucleic acid-binding Zn-ribbon protein
MQKLIPLTMIILMVISLASTIPNLYTQAVLPPKVVKFEIDKTSIYAGYQAIEVKAYIYAPATPRLSIARATLIAGLTITVNLTLTELLEAIPITVKNVTYDVKYIAIGRVIVPEAVYPGIALLRVEVEGVAAGTSFSNSTRYRVTIMSSKFVEEDRVNAYRAYERASILTFVASAQGVDVSKAMETLRELEAMLKDADSKLLTLGEVEEASALYKHVVSKAEELLSSLLLELTKISRETTTTLNNLNTKISNVEAYVKNVESSLTRYLDALTSYVRTLESALTRYSDETSKAISTLVDSLNALAKQQEDTAKRLTGVIDYVNDLGSALSQYASETNKVVESLSKDLNVLAKQHEDNVKSLNTAINTLSGSLSSLNNKVDNLAQSQNILISMVNNLQISIVVLGVAILIATAIIALRVRR